MTKELVFDIDEINWIYQLRKKVNKSDLLLQSFSNIKEQDGKQYVILGKTMATKLKAKIRDILTVQIQELIPSKKKDKLSWVIARVQDIDMGRKKPYTATQTIHIAEQYGDVLQKGDLIENVEMGEKREKEGISEEQNEEEWKKSSSNIQEFNIEENEIEKAKREGLIPKEITETVHREGKTFSRRRIMWIRPEEMPKVEITSEGKELENTIPMGIHSTISVQRLGHLIHQAIEFDSRQGGHGTQFYISHGKIVLGKELTVTNLKGTVPISVHSHIGIDWKQSLARKDLKYPTDTFSAGDVDILRKRILDGYGGPAIVITGEDTVDLLTVSPEATSKQIAAFLKIKLKVIMKELAYKQMMSNEYMREQLHNLATKYGLLYQENLKIPSIMKSFPEIEIEKAQDTRKLLDIKTGDKGRLTIDEHILFLKEDEADSLKDKTDYNDWVNARKKLSASIHHDFRVKLDNQNFLQGFTVTLGSTKEDSPLIKPEGKKFLVPEFKGHTGEGKIKWMTEVGQKESLTINPGKPGAARNSKLWAAIIKMEKDIQVKFHQVKNHFIEMEITNTKHIPSGRWILQSVPLDGQRKWMLSYPDKQDYEIV